MKTIGTLIGTLMVALSIMTIPVAICTETTTELYVTSSGNHNPVHPVISPEKNQNPVHPVISLEKNQNPVYLGWKTNVVRDALQGNFWKAVWDGIWTPSKCYSY